MFEFWLYFIKIHNLNTYDTLYTRHKQLLDLTFSVISTERKYVNYLVRAKGFFCDSAFTVKGDEHPAGNRCRTLTQTVQPANKSLHTRAFLARPNIALLVRHNLTSPRHKFKLLSSLETLNGKTNVQTLPTVLQLC